MTYKVNLQIRQFKDFLNLSKLDAHFNLNRIVNLLNVLLVFPSDNPIIPPVFSEEFKGYGHLEAKRRSEHKFGKKIVEISQTYYLSDLMFDWMFDLLQYR